MNTVVDATTIPVAVTTIGTEGQRIARTTWPDLASALAFAERMTALCGGNLSVTP